MSNFVKYLKANNNLEQLKKDIRTYGNSKSGNGDYSDLFKNLIVEYGKSKHFFSVKLSDFDESNKFFVFNDLLHAALKQLFDKNGNFLPTIIQFFEEAGLDTTKFDENSYKNQILFFFMENAVIKHMLDKDIREDIGVKIQDAKENYDINISAYMRESTIKNKWSKLDIAATIGTFFIGIPAFLVVVSSVAVPIIVTIMAISALISPFIYLAIRPWNYLENSSKILMPTDRKSNKLHEPDLSNSEKNKKVFSLGNDHYSHPFLKIKEKDNYPRQENKSTKLDEIKYCY